MTAILDAIDAKRAGRRLSTDSIAAVVDGFTSGAVPDHQMASFLMAVTCRGMSFDETVELTRAYVDSGTRLNLRDRGRTVVDKHSTGGVGDKTTLVVAPVLAELGVPVAKMSGRGLGFAGGTIDKLESIPGLRLELTPGQIRQAIDQVGMAVFCQSAELVPADAATYALRDVTGTVESAPLIAASVMSKKIAAGTDGVVLDVKFGAGGLAGDLHEGAELARLMLDVGAEFGLRCHAVLSEMDQPLGRAVGNAIEVREAIEVLRGVEVPGLTELCTALAAEALLIADARTDPDRATAQVREVLDSGRAFDRFRRWVVVQGGATDALESLPVATRTSSVSATCSGWVTDLDARAIGTLAQRLGAGRMIKEAPIDHAVGLTMHKRVGDRIRAGELLAQVHGNDDRDLDVITAVRAAYTVRARPAPPRPTVHAVLRP